VVTSTSHEVNPRCPQTFKPGNTSIEVCARLKTYLQLSIMPCFNMQVLPLLSTRAIKITQYEIRLVWAKKYSNHLFCNVSL